VKLPGTGNATAAPDAFGHGTFVAVARLAAEDAARRPGRRCHLLERPHLRARLGLRKREGRQHPRRQPLARGDESRQLTDERARQHRRAALACRHRRRRLGRQPRPEQQLLRPRQRPVRDHGRRDRHERHALELRRHAASWSSSGFTLDGYARPELLAPGRHIVSTLPSSTTMAAQAPPDNSVAPGYAMANGTVFGAAGRRRGGNRPPAEPVPVARPGQMAPHPHRAVRRGHPRQRPRSVLHSGTPARSTRRTRASRPGRCARRHQLQREDLAHLHDPPATELAGRRGRQLGRVLELGSVLELGRELELRRLVELGRQLELSRVMELRRQLGLARSRRVRARP
jgi:hypothetical protein